ncbi:24962_t:CDS:2, partial [Racocetra persica]
MWCFWNIYLAYWFSNFIDHYVNWQWIFRILTIYSGIIFFLIISFIPETFCQSDLTSKSKSSQNNFNPIAPLKLLGYKRSYNLSPSFIGLLFLAPTMGFVIGSLVGGKDSDFMLLRARKKDESVYPETRIKSVT